MIIRKVWLNGKEIPQADVTKLNTKDGWLERLRRDASGNIVIDRATRLPVKDVLRGTVDCATADIGAVV